MPKIYRRCPRSGALAALALSACTLDPVDPMVTGSGSSSSGGDDQGVTTNTEGGSIPTTSTGGDSTTSGDPTSGDDATTTMPLDTTEALTDSTTGETSDTSTTAPVDECTPAGDGLESAECIAIDPGRPFCDGGTCKPCGELGADVCFEATAGERPICHASGSCVQCDALDALEQLQCASATPHCNLDTNTCEGCFEHSECPESACDIAARECFPPEDTLFIRLAPPCSNKPEEGGTMELPYCNFPVALTHAKNTGESGITFHLLGNLDNASPGALTVAPGGPPVAYAFVHAAGGPGEAHTQFFGQGPLLTVGSNVTLYIKEFGILQSGGFLDSARGIDCQDGASVWLDDSRVLGARGSNIRGNGCEIHLRRTVVGLGETEGIDMTGGSLFAVNSFITDHGFLAGNGGGGLRMRGGATADINYTTIAGNSTEPDLGDSIQCDDDQVTIKIRNSIIASDPGSLNDSIVCVDDAITADFSVVDTEVPGDNEKVAAGELLAVLIAGKMTGLYRLDPAADWQQWFADAAQWQPGDPHFDFDREPRDTTPGINGIVGADVLP